MAGHRALRAAAVAFVALLSAGVASCGSAPGPGKGVAVGRSLPHADASDRAAAVAHILAAARDVDSGFARQRPALHTTDAVKAKVALVHASTKMDAAGTALEAVPRGVHQRAVKKAYQAAENDVQLMLNAAYCFHTAQHLHHVNPAPCLGPLRAGELQAFLTRTMHRLASESGG